MGFLVCAGERGRGGNLFCFCLVSPGEVDSSCTAWTPDPLPRGMAGGARPPSFQDPAPAEPRCDPVGMHCVPRTASSLFWTSPHPGSRPLLSPRPSLPSEDPTSGVVARSGVGEAAPDRMAMTWDVETVTSASSSLASSTSCVRAAQGWSWVFFFFFSLDSAFFFKDGILTRIALYMLGTGWKDFGIAVGGGGTPTTKQMCCSWACFYFQKPTNATVEPVLSQEE